MSKIYVIINSNYEGNNFLGVFDNREDAERGMKQYHDKREKETRELFADHPADLESQLEFNAWWHAAHIFEFEMNKMVDHE